MLLCRKSLLGRWKATCWRMTPFSSPKTIEKLKVSDPSDA
jgi:hypothetical protein